MKNLSIKFKHNIPKSSTTSQISDFDASPIPQENFQSFTQAQSISARLNKSSVYNQQNIAFNTPKCYNVPQKEMMRDEALAKSPISRRSKHYEIYENSIKRIRQCEQFLQEQLPINKQVFSSEERGLHFDQIQESDSLKKKFKKLVERVRIVRQVTSIFIKRILNILVTFKGDFASKNQNYQNYCPLSFDNGLLLNEGQQLQVSRLFGDTFKESLICYIPDKSSHYTSLCQFNDRIILGSKSGGIFGWNMLNNQHDFYFDQHQYLNQSYPTSIFYRTQDNVHYFQILKQLLALDERMQQKICLQFWNQEQRLLRASSLSISPLKKQQYGQFDSPSFKPIDVNTDMNEVNFKKIWISGITMCWQLLQMDLGISILEIRRKINSIIFKNKMRLLRLYLIRLAEMKQYTQIDINFIRFLQYFNYLNQKMNSKKLHNDEVLKWVCIYLPRDRVLNLEFSDGQLLADLLRNFLPQIKTLTQTRYKGLRILNLQYIYEKLFMNNIPIRFNIDNVSDDSSEDILKLLFDIKQHFGQNHRHQYPQMTRLEDQIKQEKYGTTSKNPIPQRGSQVLCPQGSRCQKENNEYNTQSNIGASRNNAQLASNLRNNFLQPNTSQASVKINKQEITPSRLQVLQNCNQESLRQLMEEKEICKVIDIVENLISQSQNLQEFKKALFNVVRVAIEEYEQARFPLWLNVISEIIHPEDEMLKLAGQILHSYIEGSKLIGQSNIPDITQSTLWQEWIERSQIAELAQIPQIQYNQQNQQEEQIKVIYD